MRGGSSEINGLHPADSAEKLLYDPVDQADYTSGICTLSGLSWCMGNSFMPCVLNSFTPRLEPCPVSIAAHQLARIEHP